MKEIVETSKMIPDKLAHFLVCLVGSAVFSFLFGLGASVAAEFKDMAHGGSWDWYDLIAGLVGSAVGGVVNILIIREVWMWLL